MPLSSLNASNPFHRIVRDGYDFSSTGFGRFNVGTIDISGAGGECVLCVACCSALLLLSLMDVRVLHVCM